MIKTFTAHFVSLLFCIFALAQLHVSAQRPQPSRPVNVAQADGLTKLTAADLQLILKDQKTTVLKQLSENPETRKKLLETLKQTLALAGQARKDGMADSPEAKEELASIRAEIVAANYDRRKNAGKTAMPPFGFISEEQIKTFYAEPANEAKFKAFIDKKIAQAKASGQLPADQPPTAEQIASAREFYAKTRIYEKEADELKAELGEQYNYKTELQVKLQQAQYLAQLYASQILKDKVGATDEEVQTYIARHPEFDTGAKKNTALKILSRAKSGEDFAKLAREFSEDPGSKEQGGLYLNVKKGQFVPAFENAVLDLKPGQIAPNLVETDFGYHVIKLEEKGIETYSVRHILISTMTSDPENPQLPAVPMKEKARSLIEEEKEARVMDEILAKNPIDIPEDFAIPPVSAEPNGQIKKTAEIPKRPKRNVSSKPSTTGRKPKPVRRKN